MLDQEITLETIYVRLHFLEVRNKGSEYFHSLTFQMFPGWKALK